MKGEDSTISILYVDDEPMLLDVGKLYIERSGNFSVSTAEDAKAGLNLLNEQSFDCIISDYQMPGMDGIEFLQEFRKNDINTPFIIFTGRGREEVVINAINSGADFYVQKGGDPKSQFTDLLHKVRRSVSSSGYEKKLVHSEKKYRDLVEFSPNFIYSYDSENRFKTANQSLCEFLGVSEEDIVGKSYEELGFPEDTYKYLYKLHEEVYRTKDAVRAESSITMPDGKTHHYKVVFVPIIDDEGLVRGIRGNSADITDKVNAQKELTEKNNDLLKLNEDLAAAEEEIRQQFDEIARGQHTLIETNQYMENLFNNSASLIMVWDNDLRVTKVNGAVVNLTGIPENKLTGLSLEDIITSEKLSKLTEKLRGLEPGEHLIGFEVQLKSAFGDVKTIQLDVAEIFDYSGKKIATTAQGQDITDILNYQERLLKKNGKLNLAYEEIAAAEEELRQQMDEIVSAKRLIQKSEKRMSDFINVLPDQTFAVDNNGRIIVWNAAMAAAYGKSAEEMKGKGSTEYSRYIYGCDRLTLADIILNYDEATVKQNYRSCTYENGKLEGYATFKDVNGEEKTLWGIASLLYNEEGGIEGAIETFRDITAIEKNRVELELRNEDLAAAEEEIRQQFDEISKAQHTLIETNQYMENLFNNSASLVLVWDNDFRITKVNDAVVNLTGISVSKLTGLQIDKVITPEKRAEYLKKSEGLKKGEHMTGFNNQVTSASGEIRTIQWDMADIYDYSGRKIATTAQGQDITDILDYQNRLLQKNEMLSLANEEIAASEEELRQQMDEIAIARRIARKSERVMGDVVNLLPDPTFAISKEGDIIIWNASMADKYGHSAEEMLGKDNRTLSEFVYGHDHPTLADIILNYDEATIKQNYRSCTYENGKLEGYATFKDVNGEEKTLWGIASLLYNEDGKVDGAIETFRDITAIEKNRMELEVRNEDLAAAEEEIRQQMDEISKSQHKIAETNQYMENLFNNSASFVLIWDNDFRITKANRAFLDLTGHTEGELKKLYLDSFISPEKKRELLLRMESTERGEHITGFEIPLKSSSGEVRTILWDFARIFDYSGRQISVSAQGQDITERIDFQNRLLDKNERLNLANEEIAAAEEELRQQMDEITAAHDLLSESENLYKAIFENTGTATILIGDNGDISLVNSEFERLSGYTANELKSKEWLDFVHPADRDKVLGRYAKRKESGDADLPKHYEFKFVDRKGDVHNICLTAGYSDKTKQIIVSLNDISAINRINRALRESEEKFRLIFENSPLGKFHFGKDGIITEYNDNFVDIVPVPAGFSDGIDPSVIPGRCINDAIKAIIKGDLGKFDKECVIRSGSDKSYVRVIIAPVKGREGNIKGGIGIVEDITRKRKAEEEQKRFKAIFDKANYGSVIADLNGNIIYNNKYFADVHGYAPEELTGNNLKNLHHEGGALSLPEFMGRVIEDGEFGAEELWHRNRAEEKFPMLVNGILLKNSDEVPEYIAATAIDISERKRQEESLSVANKKLKILSGITRHDILNQISALSSYIELTKEFAETSPLPDYLSRMEKTASTVRQQIEFTREYEDLGVNEPCWIDISDAVDKPRSINPGDVEIINDCGNLLVYADQMFEKVFYNLLDNTIRYGAGADKVRVHYRMSDGGIVIIFEDNGQGVEDDRKERIFDRKFGENTGYGLFLSREILSITGLTIQETGVYGEGARFEIFVPDGKFQN